MGKLGGRPVNCRTLHERFSMAGADGILCSSRQHDHICRGGAREREATPSEWGMGKESKTTLKFDRTHRDEQDTGRNADGQVADVRVQDTGELFSGGSVIGE